MVHRRLGFSEGFDPGGLVATRIGWRAGWRGEQPERGFHLGFAHRQRIGAAEAVRHQFQDEEADGLESLFRSRRFFLTSVSAPHNTS